MKINLIPIYILSDVGDKVFLRTTAESRINTKNVVRSVFTGHLLYAR